MNSKHNHLAKGLTPMPHRPIPSYQRQNARNLRRGMTDVERKLWEVLRADRIGGVSFRRQVPIGPYIADFVCHAAKLVIELDGGQHNEAGQLVRDALRDRFIADEGYRVLRFWNFEVNAEFAAVIDRIYTALIEQGLQLETSGIAATPLPVPLPQEERESLNNAGATATHSIDPITPSPVSTP